VSGDLVVFKAFARDSMRDSVVVVSRLAYPVKVAGLAKDQTAAEKRLTSAQ